jgi:hypothetical protein
MEMNARVSENVFHDFIHHVGAALALAAATRTSTSRQSEY